MGERKRCIFCGREQATDADWETLDCEDEEAKRLGLCWEGGGDECTAAALDAGRPTSLFDALTERDQLKGEVRELLEAIEAHRADPEFWPGALPPCDCSDRDQKLYAAADRIRGEAER